MILYGPNAIIKLRRQTRDSSQILPSLDDCIFRLHRGRLKVTEQLDTRKWDMVGSLGNDELIGIIPAFHRSNSPPEAPSTAPAYNLLIHEAGLKTQNHDTWFDCFIRKFNPEEDMSVTLAVVSGDHGDHGLAVYCAQGSRRCCLLDTTYGLSDEESLWTGLSA
jgi:hypothetical protein